LPTVADIFFGWRGYVRHVVSPNFDWAMLVDFAKTSSLTVDHFFLSFIGR